MRKVGVQSLQCLAQPALQNNVVVVGITALGGGLAHRNLRAVQNRVAQLAQPIEGRFFDNGFGEVAQAVFFRAFQMLSTVVFFKQAWSLSNVLAEYRLNTDLPILISL